MHVLYKIPNLPLEIAEVPLGESGESVVARIPHAIHISNHATQEEAEQAKQAEKTLGLDAIEQGGKFSA